MQKLLLPLINLAIGRGGQNVRLAARLSGWKIDIKEDASLAAPAEEELIKEENQEEEVEA